MKKPTQSSDMNRDITRRDFLNGVGIAVTGSLVSNPLSAAIGNSGAPSAQMSAEYYPPVLSGMRGSHPGSFELAHRLRDGERFDDPSASVGLGEVYDLIVVGGGISGLAAAYFFQKARGPDARILIVDNHDDFGGHAKRNEYHYKDHMLIELGGTAYIENPREYPENARMLLDELGIDTGQARDVFDHDRYNDLNLRGSVFFDKETFGEDRLVTGKPGLRNTDYQTAYITLPAELEHSAGNEDDIRAFLARAPVSESARDEIVDLFCSDTDPMPHLSVPGKLSALRKISYLRYLEEVVGASKETVDFLRMWRASYMGNGVDLTPAYAALRYGLPGAKGLGLVDEFRKPRHQPHNYKDDFHFPDGNASIARMLVRKLIPAVAPGNSMHDIVSARFDYSQLDRSGSPVRIRLNATAANVRHLDNDTVEMTYLEGGQGKRVRGSHCVLACYHSVVPHICPELPVQQKDALAKTRRMPLVSVSVLLDNWTAFEKLGIKSAYCPGSFYCDMKLTYPLRFNDYQTPGRPEQPITIRMYRIPLPGGEIPAEEQFRLGRHELLAMPFETFEHHVRDQLGRMLGDGGFDSTRDIQGISVNRWPHGYAVGYDYETEQMNYWSEAWPDEKRLWLAGRKRFGRIAVANSDAGASAMTESAIEQAWRATQDLLDDS